MAELIADTIVRYTINGQYVGRPVANVLDYQIDTTGSVTGRVESIYALAGILINEWTDSIMTELANQYSALSVSWIDLDSLEGSTGERTSSGDTVWPMAATNNFAAMPGNVALRVNKAISGTRGQRQGRMYLCGVPEAWTDPGSPNQVGGAALANLNDRLESFLGDTNQDGEGGLPGETYMAKMVVVHTVDGVFTTKSDVRSLSADPLLSSQRRRLRG